ncbi:MAG: hypothetical protein KGL39_04900 [Patescibacteria group bacterium]|nr:hypothetical protein [Patescibacteria group bacterium]
MVDKELLKSLDYAGGGRGHVNTLCAQAASVIRELESGPFWVVEKYLFGMLHYWSAGARGRGHQDDFATDIGWATKLHDEESASQVLHRLCSGEGRCTQHMFLNQPQVTK